jgi:hypothetical protein
VVGQGDVDDSAVGGGHRFQGDAAPGLVYSGGDLASHVFQRLLAALAVMLHIQDNSNILAQFLADNQVSQELQGSESLTAAANEQSGVFPGKVDYGAPNIWVMGGTKGADNVDLGWAQEIVYHLDSQVGSAPSGRSGSRRAGVAGGQFSSITGGHVSSAANVIIAPCAGDFTNPDLGQFSPNSQESGFAFT